MTFDPNRLASFPNNIKEGGPGGGIDLNPEEVLEISKSRNGVIKGIHLLPGAKIGDELWLQGPDFKELGKITGITPMEGSKSDVTVELLEKK